MFPQINSRQSFPALEEEILAYWDTHKTFQKSLDIRKGGEEFSFYDGPPFATGTPHYGHILAGTIKDAIPRYQTMRGKYVERRFGWDCHGLPIENIVEKKLGISGKRDIEDRVGVYEFNEECRKNVFGYVEDWRRVVRRIGRWIDMDNDYKTMDTDFMESVWWVFGELYKKGLIYERDRVVPYCPRCATPLANFEVNQGYENKQDKAVTVKFKVVGNSSKYILAWTTTPWTLPANLGLAVGEGIGYSEILDKASGDTYVLATDRIATYYKSSDDYTLVRSYPGSCLVGLKYEPLYFDWNEMSELPRGMNLGSNVYSVVVGHHVTTDSGTGVVHIAPAFGEDDNIIGIEKDLGYVGHINMTGNVEHISFGAGEFVFDYNDTVIRDLKDRKILVHIGTIDHSYPHCYRCKTPLIYRGISAWYVDVESLRDKMLANNAKTNWTPEMLRDGRFGKWLEGARDWNISRNRYWGSAIPVWKSEDGEVQVCVSSIAELYELNKEFGDIYLKDGQYYYTFTNELVDIHKHFVDKIRLKDPQSGKTLTRVTEVLDCWFESGSMPYAQKHFPFGEKDRFTNTFPADFIAEGLDQTRGWFYTLMVLSTALFDEPPFHHVLVNGLILAEDGKKMSKSLKNYPDPELLLSKHGADALRFYILSSPATRAEDLRFSEQGVEEIVKSVILPLWNTYSFFTTYANIDGWSPKKGSITLVRHAESEANATGRVSDSGADVHITELGKQQAYETAKRLKLQGKTFDRIIVTPSIRTQETAEIVRRELGLEHLDLEIHAELQERSAGQFSRMTLAEMQTLDPSVTHANYFEKALAFGAETEADFLQRVNTHLDALEQKYPNERILMVAHGGTGRAVGVSRFARSSTTHEHALRLVNAEVLELPPYPLVNPLDIWMSSRLQVAIAEVTSALDEYHLPRATTSIVRLIDDITNFYVRRSRKRFWKSGNDSDKLSAYETLHRTLVSVTQLLAPICPFISESLYCGLTGSESVHLSMWPEFSRHHVNTHLNAEMEDVRSVIRLGLSLRAQKKIRVRQPLSRITISREFDEMASEIIRDELNIHEIVTTSPDTIARSIIKVDARLLGPKFGKEIQSIIQSGKQGIFESLEDGRVVVAGHILEIGEFTNAYEPYVQGSDVAGEGHMVIALDTSITPELACEGYARDLVRIIQDMRKEANYDVSDRIEIALSGAIDDVIQGHGMFIQNETLAVFVSEISQADLRKSEEFDELGTLEIAIRRLI